jgi:hypothetical protein
LGIVDGAMGILSRKMAMPNIDPEGRARPGITGEVSGMSPHMERKMKEVDPEWRMAKL